MALDRLEAEVQSYPAVLVEAEALVSVRVRLRERADTLWLERFSLQAPDWVRSARLTRIAPTWFEFGSWPSPAQPMALPPGAHEFALSLRVRPPGRGRYEVAVFELQLLDQERRQLMAGPFTVKADVLDAAPQNPAPPWLNLWDLGTLVRKGLAASGVDGARSAFLSAEVLAESVGHPLLLALLRQSLHRLGLGLPLAEATREALARAPLIPWPAVRPTIEPPPAPPQPEPARLRLHLRLLNGREARWPEGWPEPEGNALEGLRLVASSGVCSEPELRRALGRAGLAEFNAFRIQLLGLDCVLTEYVNGVSQYRLDDAVIGAWSEGSDI